MLFDEKPTKLQDGRYFLKVSDARHQVNGVRVLIKDDQPTILVSDSDLFSTIDEAIITQAKESKVAWFGKEVSDETVVSAYQKSLTPESELIASFVKIRGEVVTSVYDTQKNQVSLDQISPETSVDVLLELFGLVFTKRSFEPVWKVVQVRIKNAPKQKFPREYLFADDPVEEEEPDVDL